MNCTSGLIREFSRWQTAYKPPLFVNVLCFDFQFFLTRFANPVMFAINERVVMDALAVVIRAEIAFHKNAILS